MPFNVDFSKMFHGVTRDFGSNLTMKIGNPPELKTYPTFCMWSDLLGFSSMFDSCNWEPDSKQQRKIYERLLAAHSSVLYYSQPYERCLILNDGIAKVFRPRTMFEDRNNILGISLYLRSCIELHLTITQTEKSNGYPGCRSVIAFGESIEYLANEVRFDDYVMNYSKPKGEEISDVAKHNGNPIIIYNPAELQMNSAFAKSYIIEGGGSKAGIPGNNLYVDHSVVEAIEKYAREKRYKPVWIETDDYIRFLIPRDRNNLDSVVLGFEFEKEPIYPKDLKYKTKVYKLRKYFPHDELISEFCFDMYED